MRSRARVRRPTLWAQNLINIKNHGPILSACPANTFKKCTLKRIPRLISECPDRASIRWSVRSPSTARPNSHWGLKQRKTNRFKTSRSLCLGQALILSKHLRARMDLLLTRGISRVRRLSFREATLALTTQAWGHLRRSRGPDSTNRNLNLTLKAVTRLRGTEIVEHRFSRKEKEIQT